MNKFASIEALRNVVTSVRKYFDSRAERYPTITFDGTVKLHGSNAGVRVVKDSVRPQSRERLLSLGSDNAGFFSFCHPRFDIFKQLTSYYDSNDLTFYGEWCGGNIQPNVALAQLPKHLVLFDVWNSRAGDEGGYIGLDKFPNDIEFVKSLNTQGIWLISQVPSYSVDIDFNDPQKAADIMTELTLRVENTCPWGELHGVTGIGEGICWKARSRPYDTRLWFKTKGLLHKGNDKTANKKHKLYATPEKVNEINSLIDLLLPEWRLEQAYAYVKDVVNGQPTNKQTGTFLKWIHTDVLKEETDVIVANGKEWKDIVGDLSKRAKNWYFKQIGGEF